MGVVLWPVPRHAPADKHVESSWCHRNGVCQYFLCLLYATCLTEGRGKPAIHVRIIGVCADAALSRFHRGIVFAGQVITNRNIQQTEVQVWVARVESDAFLESGAPFPRLARPHQDCTKGSVCTGQIWADRESRLDLGERALVVSPSHQL